LPKLCNVVKMYRVLDGLAGLTKKTKLFAVKQKEKFNVALICKISQIWLWNSYEFPAELAA
jgi:hypothetical protein